MSAGSGSGRPNMSTWQCSTRTLNGRRAATLGFPIQERHIINSIFYSKTTPRWPSACMARRRTSLYAPTVAVRLADV